MQTQLAPAYRDTPEGQEAEAILRKCVHCGFCSATCPTYQLLGDELDSPRGRIYLIKQVLEGHTPTRATQQHLDRCLTCRNCETTCPSGVQYGRLVDIGRNIVEGQVTRPLREKAMRWALKQGLPSPLFAPALAAGRAVRPLLPARLQDKIPPRTHAGAWPTRTHTRKVLLLQGCVQPALAPRINAATARVLDAAHIQTVVLPQTQCCGAVKFHLNDQAGGKAHMRANIDLWWPHIQSGAIQHILINASGCAVTVKDYGHLLRHDPHYADKAAHISHLARDLCELLPELVEPLRARITPTAAPLAWHPPCTLQHGQQLRNLVEPAMHALGFTLHTARTESHLCCGAAGTYSVLYPELAQALRQRKLTALQPPVADAPPSAIVSANIGCISHLQSGSPLAVKHWIEVLDETLA